MTDHVHVVAVLKVKPGQRQALIDAFRTIVPEVLAEDGCITYVPSIDTADAGDNQSPYGDDTLVVVEEWESLAHLNAPQSKRAHAGLRRHQPSASRRSQGPHPVGGLNRWPQDPPPTVPPWPTSGSRSTRWTAC